MREQKRIAVSEIERDPDQPRKTFDEAELLALGQNMQAVGQQVPAIVYVDGAKYRLADGERRWRAAQLVGMKDLLAVLLERKPTAAELLLIQGSIDIHRKGFTPMERSNLLARILKETGCSVTEVGEKLGVKQAMSSKLLTFQKGAPPVQQAINDGAICVERGYIICQEPDHAKQLELLKGAAALSRDQLRQKAKGNGEGKAEVKTMAARFVMPGGMTITVAGRDMTLTTAIEVMTETLKQLKKGQNQGLDISTQQRVMRDQIKAVR